MALPISVTYTFATATSAIPLSQLDANFTTVVNGINGIGNGTNALSNVSITGGAIDGATIGATTSSTGRFSTVTATTGNITTINATTLNAATHRSDTSLTFQSNGTTTAMTIDTSQNVGIGTSSPAVKLDVNGAISLGASNNLTWGGAYGANIPTIAGSSTNGITFYPTGSTSGETMRINASGNVGIGTSSPLSILTAFQSADGYDKGITLARTGANRGTIFLNASNDTMNFGRSGNTNMTIDSSGNVGIGTSSPNAKLEVFKDGAPAASGNMNTGMVVSAAAGSYAINIGATASGAYSWINSAFQNNSGTAAPLVFATGATERARIDSSGNLLVGTTSTAASALFRVNGTAYIDSLIYSPGVYNQTTGNAANLHVASDGNFFRSTSSLKYKTDVKDATHGLTELLTLRPVTYKGKNDGDTIFGGLIAEEVHAAGLTEFVQYAEDGSPDALAYGNMVSLCIKAIQELKAEIDALKGAK